MKDRSSKESRKIKTKSPCGNDTYVQYMYMYVHVLYEGK